MSNVSDTQRFQKGFMMDLKRNRDEAGNKKVTLGYKDFIATKKGAQTLRRPYLQITSGFNTNQFQLLQVSTERIIRGIGEASSLHIKDQVTIYSWGYRENG